MGDLITIISRMIQLIRNITLMVVVEGVKEQKENALIRNTI